MSKILRLPEVITRTGRSRSSIYSDIQKGKFPQSVQIGERSIGWLCNEIDAWIEERAAVSRKSEVQS